MLEGFGEIMILEGPARESMVPPEKISLEKTTSLYSVIESPLGKLMKEKQVWFLLERSVCAM
jgi:hypothetical protein